MRRTKLNKIILWTLLAINTVLFTLGITGVISNSITHWVSGFTWGILVIYWVHAINDHYYYKKLVKQDIINKEKTNK